MGLEKVVLRKGIPFSLVVRVLALDVKGLGFDSPPGLSDIGGSTEIAHKCSQHMRTCAILVGEVCGCGSV